MKEIKELKFEELTLEQKIGMVMVSSVRKKEDIEFTLELIKKRACGAVWVYATSPLHDEAMSAMREAADYPIIFISDAEEGLGDYIIGRHNALGMANNEELAYAFGKVTAIQARKKGINIICNPLLDMVNGNCACGANIRSIGSDKETVSRLAAAEARGMHDGGVLTVGKHYPGTSTTAYIDSHMAETVSDATVEELLDYNLYPYKYLIDRGLLDGVMTEHTRFHKIDPEYPASLSKDVIGIIRERLGFRGFCVTDALPMMGIVARFGKIKSKGMAIAAGNDLALVFGDPRNEFNIMLQCYNEGVFTEEELDRAVMTVLETQHKIMNLSDNAEITDKDLDELDRINKDSVYAKTDEGIPQSISKDGKHLFAVLTDISQDFDTPGRLAVDTVSNSWYKPEIIVEKLNSTFPNSGVYCIKEYPTRVDVAGLLDESTKYDDVIFITYFNSAPYLGREMLSSRIISIFEAMQMTNKVSAVVHFGNPYVLEDLPHIPRVLVAPSCYASTVSAIDVLCGDYPAYGVLTYDVKIK